MRLLILLGLAACRKEGYSPPIPSSIPDDVPIPREGGPVAGPRAVVDQAPPRPVAEGTPGGGTLPPWLAQLRSKLNGPLDACLASGPATIKSGTALVTARIDAGGGVHDVTLVRSSGSEAYDACLLGAFRAARPDPPPADALVDGQLPVEIAFR